jgi:hypothetical protein
LKPRRVRGGTTAALPTVRFSLTKTTECSQTRSLQPTSLTHLISLVEAGSVPTLADAAILAIDRAIEMAKKSLELGFSRQQLQRNPEMMRLFADPRMQATP